MRAFLVLAFFLFITVSGSAFAQSGSGALSGTVVDTAGTPIAGADVTLRGPSVFHATSDAKGAFEIANVPAAVYALSVAKAGYSTANQSDVAVLAGEIQTVAIRLEALTFSSLRTIATVKVGGKASINTSQAAVNVVNTQTFVDQSAPQVTRVLSQIPGVQISFPSNSANAAAPGAITIPNIRGATSYETASLIDGHPISVGQYGDNVTTFLNSFMFENVEIVKGPGADSPVVNNAIGGTTNFRTKDPTPNISASVLAGLDNHGGSFSNFSVSDTLGRLGFVVDVATTNEASPLDGKSVYYDPGNAYNAYSVGGHNFSDNSSGSQLYPTASYVYNQFPLVACCYALHGFLNETAELVKFRYKFSDATTATVSYLGSQAQSDQNGNTSAFIVGSAFVPDPSYTGSLKPGALAVSNIYPGADNFELNNEPILQAEVNTTLGRDSILARFYHATISRYQYTGNNPLANDTQAATLFGSNYDSNNNLVVFNGTPATLSYPDYYNEPELDKLSGGTFEYQHPFGDNTVSFSVDRTLAQTVDYSVFSGPFYSFNLPPGTNQTLTTYMLRGHFLTGPKLETTVTDYVNTYRSAYPTSCTGSCNTLSAAVLGAGVNFGSSSYSHNDPRIGFVYRPTVNSSLRFAAGSAIAPPFMGLLNQVATIPQQVSPGSTVALTSVSNGSIKPETAFGYDVGGDIRLKDGTVFAGDVYLTNLYNRFFGQTYPTGLNCSQTACVDQNNAPVTSPSVNIFQQINTNISNARFEGIELVAQRQPAVGFGYRASVGLEKGYYYDLPPFFYCSIPGPGCTYDQNLNIISGQNTNGVGVGVGGLNYNGNMRIPYSQGDLELSYTLKNGAYAMFGETYYGTNNSLNEPPFGIAYATLRYPLREGLALQISGDNVFNAYPGILPLYGGGVPIPLADGTQSATSGNVLGPATYRFSLIFTPK